MDGDAPPSRVKVTRVGLPVLAIYCRSPERGKVKTRLAAEIGEEAALEFYKGCLRLLKKELPTCRPHYQIAICPAEKRDRHWAEEEFPFADLVLPQVKGDLGLRLQTTQVELRALGNDRVVLLGSDSPSLPAPFLHDMRRLLEGFDVVLGPALDGGVWGIGARALLPGLLTISWSTSNVYNELTEACHRGDLTVGVLPSWYDVDDRASLQLAADDLIRSPSLTRQEFGTWIESLFFKAGPRSI